MTTATQQLIAACSRLKKLDSYEPPLRTHWITRHDADNIIALVRLMPVMVEALEMSRCECTYWYGPQYGQLKLTAPCARCHALSKIAEEFKPESESAAVPSKDLVDWLNSLPVTTDETRQRVRKAFESLNEEGAAGELLPCPFCGGQFIPEHPKMAGSPPFRSVPRLEELLEGEWRVCCYGCGVQTWDQMEYTKEQAIAAWNTRTLSPAHPNGNARHDNETTTPKGDGCAGDANSE
jgi:uncharacterized protein with PIN domain